MFVAYPFPPSAYEETKTQHNPYATTDVRLPVAPGTGRLRPLQRHGRRYRASGRYPGEWMLSLRRRQPLQSKQKRDWTRQPLQSKLLETTLLGGRPNFDTCHLSLEFEKYSWENGDGTMTRAFFKRYSKTLLSISAIVGKKEVNRLAYTYPFMYGCF